MVRPLVLATKSKSMGWNNELQTSSFPSMLLFVLKILYSFIYIFPRCVCIMVDYRKFPYTTILLKQNEAVRYAPSPCRCSRLNMFT